MVLRLKPRQSESRACSLLSQWRCLGCGENMEIQVSFWPFFIKSSQSGFPGWLVAICVPQLPGMPILKWKCKNTIQIKLLWRWSIKLSLPLEPGKCKLSLPGDEPKYICLNDWTGVSVTMPRQLTLTLLSILTTGKWVAVRFQSFCSSHWLLG